MTSAASTHGILALVAALLLATMASTTPIQAAGLAGRRGLQNTPTSAPAPASEVREAAANCEEGTAVGRKFKSWRPLRRRRPALPKSLGRSNSNSLTRPHSLTRTHLTHPRSPQAPAVTAQGGPFTASASTLPPSWLPSGGPYQGDGTAFSQPVADGKGFACSFRYLSGWARTAFAAMNSPQWDEGAVCGRCITAWCVDERCPTRNQKVQVQVSSAARAGGGWGASVGGGRAMGRPWRLQMWQVFLLLLPVPSCPPPCRPMPPDCGQVPRVQARVSRAKQPLQGEGVVCETRRRRQVTPPSPPHSRRPAA